MDSLTPQTLDRLLTDADPAVVLISPRILRRVIKRSRKVRGALGQVPHRKTLVVSRERLLDSVARWELEVEPGRQLPDTVILLERPSLDRLREMEPEEALVRWWRLLFHASVHRALESPPTAVRLDQAAVRRRIDSIGQTAFDEIRAVLAGEKLLFERRSERDEYVEFAALFLELIAFAPQHLRRYFPDLADRSEEILRALSEDVDWQALFQSTRPAGAPDPLTVTEGEVQRPPRAPRRRRREGGDVRRSDKLVARAERKELAGNLVRGAILRQRAAGAGDRIDPDASAVLDRLVRRLKAALAFDAKVEGQWRDLLPSLLPRAAAGFRSAEGKLLYDLQKVCSDHERGLFTVDLLEWCRSLGRRPLKRPLPLQREILMCRHLRAARRRLVAVRLSEHDRVSLDGLVSSAERLAETRLRRRCRPAIGELLESAGFRPSTVVGRVARDKLTEELIDRVASRGFIALGDVRDAFSRNQLKLEDCSGLRDFANASGLLKVDRELSVSLDGVYRRGEVYLRWLQRLSALVFGTRFGRWVSLWGAIPFGGAYVVLRGLQEMLAPLGSAMGRELRFVDPGHLSVVVLGVYLMGIIHVNQVREASVRVLRQASARLRWLLWDGPRHLMEVPAVKRFLRGVVWRSMLRFLIKPAALSLVLFGALVWFVDPESWWRWLLGLFVAAELALNSPIGTAVEEISTDWAWRTWNSVRGTLVVGLLRLTLRVFHAVLEAVERALYLVDEWLRFRSGEGRLTFVLKAALGVLWQALTWLVRVLVNLLLEPQVNPVKHFPVVTVSHKMMLPLIPTLIAAMNGFLEPALGLVVANAISWTVVSLSPGFFGFMVWELKENWKLFAANRAPTLKPALVGGHGETVLRLMRPGFHSGTLPKAYARLRRAERKSQWTGEMIPARRQREVIHHVEADVRVWIERELVALLNESEQWGDGEIRVGAVSAGSNRVRVSLQSPRDGADPMVLAFEEQSGLLVAHVGAPGWLPALGDHRRAVFRSALCGLYHTGGVDVVREDVEHHLGSPPPPYDIADSGLLVWPGDGYDTEEVRDLNPLLFSRAPIPWVRWVAVWEAEIERSGDGRLLDQVRVLP